MAKLIKFISNERNETAIINEDPALFKGGPKTFEFAEVEKPTQSPASTERVRSTSSESKSKSTPEEV